MTRRPPPWLERARGTIASAWLRIRPGLMRLGRPPAWVHLATARDDDDPILVVGVDVRARAWTPLRA